jgi:hypothetical protein
MAISANDASRYPADSFANMERHAPRRASCSSYAHDES